MKTKLYLLCFVLGIFSIQSCDGDNNTPQQITDEAKVAFADKYPGALDVKWDLKSGYAVADFKQDNIGCAAWFDMKGAWYMTKKEITYTRLPQAVKSAFEESKYSAWKVDDVDLIERRGYDPIYYIEVESNDVEVGLYYAQGGTLVKETIDIDKDDDHGGMLPVDLSAEIKAFILNKYPGAKIVDVDYEKTKIEVDIIHNLIGKEVVFNLNKQWMQTSWEVSIYALPAAVKATVSKNYIGYEIDDADYVETLQVNYYLLELEKGKSEIKVKIRADGTVLQ